MYESGFPFGRVVGVSGSGQQHGSVYWKNGTELTLARLQSTLSLHQQLQVLSLSLPPSLPPSLLLFLHLFSLLLRRVFLLVNLQYGKTRALPHSVGISRQCLVVHYH